MLLVILKVKKLLQHFTKRIAKDRSKRVQKLIKRKGNKFYMLTKKAMIILLTFGLIKMT